jgi:hypothetical protein
MITKWCYRCKETKPIADFYKDGDRKDGCQGKCKSCTKLYEKENRAHLNDCQRERSHRTGKKRPLAEAIDSSSYLGVYVAERVLSNFFDHIQRMPYGNKGFDFICGRGFKIDCKSACIYIPSRNHVSGGWSYRIKRNVEADYFLCLAFDSRKSLVPKHVWLIPGEIINHLMHLYISSGNISKWAAYEKPLDRVIACCSDLRDKARS